MVIQIEDVALNDDKAGMWMTAEENVRPEIYVAQIFERM